MLQTLRQIMLATRRHGLLATVAALVLVAGQLLGLSHLVEVQHAICAEHGELVHVSGPANDGGTPHADAPRRSPSEDIDDEHVHCEVCVESDAVTLPGPDVPVTTIELAPVAKLRSSLTPPAIAILRRAPKGSPPA